MIVTLNQFGSIISDDKIGAEILRRIDRELHASGDPVLIDFDRVLSITTFNAKQIFGELYFKLGPEEFFKRILIRNASDNIITIIKMGITDRMSVVA